MIKAQLAYPSNKVGKAKFVTGDRYFMEEKLDGIRILVSFENGVASFWNRYGVALDVPALSGLSEPRLTQTLFDGELIGDTYHVFDVVRFQGVECSDIPFDQRRLTLETINPARIDGFKLVPCAKTADEKKQLLADCLDRDAEGVMFKLHTSPYRSGRTKDWVKLKFTRTTDVVIMEMNRKDKAEAVTVGVYADGTLQEVGGLRIAGKHLPFVAEGYVVEVRYLYLTEDNKLYQPTFVRVRNDKSPTSCTKETLMLESRNDTADVGDL
jgi:bifunctional non-homologous end joining protein LigD